MIQIDNRQAFLQALEDLPAKKQRQVGARFIGNVLDLASEPQFRNVLSLLEKPDLSAEELLDGYHSIHALYTQTHPRSDLSELDYRKQAAHFIAEACLVCLAPTYPEAKIHRIAEKTAMYCRMARTCASIMHDEDQPDLQDTETALRKEIEAQYSVVNEFLSD